MIAVGLRFERLDADGEIESIVDIGPFVAIAYRDGTMIAYHEDGVEDEAALAPRAGVWWRGGHQYHRVVVYPWPDGDQG